MGRSGTSNRRFRLVSRTVGPLIVAAMVLAALPIAAGAAPRPGPVPVDPAVAGGEAPSPRTPPMGTATCPWLTSAMAAGESPAALAALVVSRMTLAEKLG